MSTPIDELIAALEASGGLSAVSISGMVSQPSPPAVVIRPYEPWLEPSTFCDFLQHYVAVPLVQAASVHEGVTQLYLMALAIIDALPDTWDLVSVGQPTIDESTGPPFLVIPIRLDYKGAAQ